MIAVSGVSLALALLWVAAASTAVENGNFHPPRHATWQMPSAHLYGVAISGRRALAVGYWGTALYSSDAGASWHFSETPTSRTLFGVSFSDPKNAWAVGDYGIVLRTRDGGESWTKVTVEAIDEFGDFGLMTVVLFDVATVSPEEIWISGDFGTLLHTTDGGATWTSTFLPEEKFGDGYLADRLLNGIEFEGPDNGWVAGEFATGLRTVDGGKTWTNRQEVVGAISDIYLFDIGVSGENAVAGGVGGVVLYTRDNGKIWTAKDAPTTAGLFAAALRGNRAILAGDRGEVVASRDHGETWFQPRRPKIFNWFAGAAFGDDGLALIVGERGAILRSTDGGDSFGEVVAAAPMPASAISVPEASTKKILDEVSP
jgi:photosystem II stability/assembly factor-like uncharacterized protein